MGFFSKLFGDDSNQKIVTGAGFMARMIDDEMSSFNYIFNYKDLSVDANCNTEDLICEIETLKKAVHLLKYDCHELYDIHLKKLGRDFGFHNDDYSYTDRIADLFEVVHTIVYDESIRYSHYEGDQLKSYSGDQQLLSNIEEQQKIIYSILEKDIPYYEGVKLPIRTESDYSKQKKCMNNILFVCQSIKDKCTELSSQIKNEQALFKIGLIKVLTDIVYYISQSISMIINGYSMAGQSVAAETKYAIGLLKFLKFRTEEFLYICKEQDMFEDDFFTHFNEISNYETSYIFMQYKIQKLSKQ